MLNFQIRKMHKNDLQTVIELAMLANPFTTKKKYYRHLEDELYRHPDLSFVAVENGRIIGYVQADIHDNEATLEDIAVDKNYQGKGIGKQLLEKEMKTLKQRKVKTIIAEVHYKCAKAIPFYYKYNFRITDCKQDRFGNGHDAIILTLKW